MQWGVLLFFLIVQMGIGLWASRHVRDESDYFVAGRQLGPTLVTFSLFATWFGAETCLGASGAVYANGLSGARADPISYALCLLIMGVFLAVRLSAARFMTLGDLYRERFSPSVEKLAVCAILPSSLVWAAAQIRALGQVLSSTSGLSVDGAVLIAATVVITYTFIGGLMGDIVTDLVQGILLSLGLCALFVVVCMNMGDINYEHIFSEDRLSLWPKNESVWSQIDRWSVPILGSLITQELIARILAARSPQVARWSSILASFLYIVIGSIPIILGLLGPALIPKLQDPEQLLPVLAQTHLPYAIYILFSWSLMAALLSTVDSILLSSSALASHNVIVPLLHLQALDTTKLWLGRVMVAIFGIVACIVGLYAKSVYGLVETASTIGTAGILITTVGGLFFKFGGQFAAAAGIIAGGITTPLFEHVFQWEAPFLGSVVTAALIYISVGFAEKHLLGSNGFCSIRQKSQR